MNPPLDFEVETLRGETKRLHQYRRRSHVLLIVDPEDGPERRKAQRTLHDQQSQTWTWLQTVLVRPAEAPPGLEPGNHLVDRWGRLIASYPPGLWDLARIEDDLLHWEDRNGCDLCAAP